MIKNRTIPTYWKIWLMEIINRGTPIIGITRLIGTTWHFWKDCKTSSDTEWITFENVMTSQAYIYTSIIHIMKSWVMTTERDCSKPWVDYLFQLNFGRWWLLIEAGHWCCLELQTLPQHFEFSFFSFLCIFRKYNGSKKCRECDTGI
jgi:hypothetical protein